MTIIIAEVVKYVQYTVKYT